MRVLHATGQPEQRPGAVPAAGRVPPAAALQQRIGNRGFERLLRSRNGAALPAGCAGGVRSTPRRPPAPAGRILGDTAADAGADCVAAVPDIAPCAPEVASRVRSGPEVVARRMLRAAIRVLGGPSTPELFRQLENSFGMIAGGSIPPLRGRFERMLALLDRVSYFCPSAASPCCEGLGYGAFVISDRPDDVYLCPSFFNEDETARHGQPFTLLHELAHLAGADHHHVRLQYYAGMDCGPIGLRGAAQGLENADSYPHFAACADRGLTPPVRRPETPRPRSRSLIDRIEARQRERMRERILESVDTLLPPPGLDGHDAPAPLRDRVPDLLGGGLLPYREAIEAVARARFLRNSGIVDVDVQIPLATIDHTLSGREIAALVRESGRRRAAADNAGLTRARLGMRMTTRTAAGASEAGRIPFWLTSLRVTPLFRSITVYIAREYGRGSCEYRETLAHENEHVDVNRELLQRYAGRMRAALVFSYLPTRDAPLSVGSEADGDAAVERLLRGILTPVYDELREKLREAHAALDTPEHYRRVHDRCGNW